MQLRPYQSDCAEAVYREWQECRSALAVLATGLGKTVIGAHVIGHWLHRGMAGRILWLAHRKELIEQAAASIRRWAGIPVAIEMGDSYSDEGGFFQSAPVVVGSVQTLSSVRRKLRFRPDRFGLIIIDEAHHALAPSYRGIFDYFRAGNPDIRLLGITATPKRADTLAMGQVFDTVAFEYGIEAAVADGWLVPVSQAVVVVDDLDLSKVHTVGDDYKPGELEAIVSRDKVLHEMAAPAVEMAGDKQTLVFAVGVEQAERLCGVLNDYRPGKAAWVSGETDDEKRSQIVTDFRQGRMQFLVNCGVFLEGFDAPATTFVVMGRPTKSLPLYTQMLGRATRPLPGVVEGIPDAASRRHAIAQSAKPAAIVLDFVGNAQQHAACATVNAADVLGGKYTDATRQYAKARLQTADGPRAIEEELERAEAEMALLREEEERKARIVAEVDYSLRYVGDGPQREFRTEPRGKRATEKQVNYLVYRMGYARHKAEKMSVKQAGFLIGRHRQGEGAA